MNPLEGWLSLSSPKDAAWISPSGNLRCTSFSEIVLLLHSSDSLVHDLCHAYDTCSNKTSSRPGSFFLALRKWQPALQPEMEFRCFVQDYCLVGISQREVTTFYPTLLEQKGNLKGLIENFFFDKVRPNFDINKYSFDVYDEWVKILDFNPWGGSTLPLLFSWEEVEHDYTESKGVEFRIVESQRGVRPGLKTAVPYDFLDTCPGSGWDEFFKKANDDLRVQTETLDADARRFFVLVFVIKPHISTSDMLCIDFELYDYDLLQSILLKPKCPF